jgi:nucleotide-binding universal stress UspA family protein
MGRRAGLDAPTKAEADMTWRDILVHLQAVEEWSGHIDIAISLAKTFDARLTGLRTSTSAATIKHYLGASSPAALEIEEKEAALAAEAEKRFRQALAASGVEGDWDVAEGSASDILSVAGRVHDLIVVRQRRMNGDEPGFDVAETCAVWSGTPTLVAPCAGSFPTVGERVLVAWNGSQQASAAVHGALPLIERAKHVTVLIGKGKESVSSITRYPKLDIVGYLGRHAAEVSTYAHEAGDWDAGAKILDVVDRTESDLIVMGAYGSSAWRELFLGGATRHVLEHMTVPVLMAH